MRTAVPGGLAMPRAPAAAGHGSSGRHAPGFTLAPPRPAACPCCRVDPQFGNNANSGAAWNAAKRTLEAAWDMIPSEQASKALGWLGRLTLPTAACCCRLPLSHSLGRAAAAPAGCACRPVCPMKHRARCAAAWPPGLAQVLPVAPSTRGYRIFIRPGRVTEAMGGWLGGPVRAGAAAWAHGSGCAG